MSANSADIELLVDTFEQFSGLELNKFSTAVVIPARNVESIASQQESNSQHLS